MLVPNATVGGLVLAAAQRSSGAPAICATGRAPLSYAELRRLTDAVARTLESKDLSRKRIALTLPDGPEMAVAALGIVASATCVPLNPNLRRTEFEFALADLGVDALVAQQGSDIPAVTAAHDLGIPVLDLVPDPANAAGTFRLRASKEGSGDGGSGRRPPSAQRPVRPSDVGLVLHTSGTTARPKAVPITQHALAVSAANIARTLQLTGQDVCLNLMPMFHIHGFVCALLASIASGASVVCTKGLRAAHFFEWLELHRATWYTAVPTMHQAILIHATAADTLPDHSLRFVRSSSAPLPPSVMQELSNILSAPVIEAYGMTEAAHQIASNPLGAGRQRPGSVGLASGPEVAVMSATGNLLEAGEVGEIVLRGETVIDAYENNPAANSSAFEHGWFRTGDQGYVDDRGYLFLTGRLKELINRGGEKISPREVDEALLVHPSVVQAVTFAIPDRRLGEDVGAAVVLRGDALPSADEIREFVATHLAAFKVPRLLKIVDEIPGGATGKPHRSTMAARLGIGDSDPLQSEGERIAAHTDAERSLVDIWQRILRHTDFGVTDDFFDVGGDSIAATELLADLAKELGVEMPLLTFLQEPTIAAITRSCAIVPGSGRAHPDGQPALVPVRTVGEGAPMFVMGGHDNVLWGLCAMARYLNDQRPLYGLQTPGIDRSCLSYRLEELAARCIARIREVQPSGPYYLLGFCFGGWVMFEMARQLVASGDRVGLLVMMECVNDRRHERLSFRSVVSQRLGLWRRRDVHLSAMDEHADGRASYFRERSNAFIRSFANDLGHAIYDLSIRRNWPVWQLLQRPSFANRRAEVHYVPGLYSGATLLVRVSSGASSDPTSPPRPAPPQTDWRAIFTGEVEDLHVHGDRRRIWYYPTVRDLGDAVNLRLETARTRSGNSRARERAEDR